jgi:ADP-ribose pyrophosphatase
VLPLPEVPRLQRGRHGAPADLTLPEDRLQTPAPDDLPIPDVAGSEQIFRGRMVGMRVDTLRGADGGDYTREVVEYGVAVVIVPVQHDGRLLLVRQYRHPARAWLLELPAGGVDARDASPEAAALRELREETGHSGTLRRIGGMYLAPGYSEEYQHVYVAEDLVEDALAADEDEDLRLESLTLEHTLARVDAGEIRDAKSIAGLLMYLRYLKKV